MKVILALSLFVAGAARAELPFAGLFAEPQAVWHCTAYPDTGHPHGYSARDRARPIAFDKAKTRCERATGRTCARVECREDRR